MAFSDTIAELQKIDGEDFKRIGSAHIILRGFLMVVACAAVIGLIVHFLIKPQFDELKVVEAKELELRATFDAEQAKAANRLAYLEQLAEMKKQFSVMLRHCLTRQTSKACWSTCHKPVSPVALKLSTSSRRRKFRVSSTLNIRFASASPVNTISLVNSSVDSRPCLESSH